MSSDGYVSNPDATTGCRKRSSRAQADLLVDGHVHLHPGVDAGVQLSAAWRNLASFARGARFEGVLCLADLVGSERFADLVETAHRGGAIALGWTVHATAEPEALRAEGPDDERLAILTGWQLRTEESLEVLALATREPCRERLRLAETVARVRGLGGIAVIPWGFGKWWGRRGRVLERFLSDAPTEGVYLGDNGGRPGWLARPRHFRLAEARGMAVLPGSDPLPVPWERARAGSQGFRMRCRFDPERPASSLRDALAAAPPEIAPLGGRESLPRFITNQVVVQIRKRTWARA